MISRATVAGMGTRLVAVALCAALYAAAVSPAASSADRSRLAERFDLSPIELMTMGPGAGPAAEARTTRTVNPSLERIEAWISSVGAAVALGDVDGDGVANDLCTVDPRTDTVLVSGAPGTGSRYRPFELRPSGLDDDASTAPMGCMFGDLDANGTTDVLVYHWGRSPVLHLRRQPERLGSRAFAARELVASVPRWFTNAATLADLDGDGRLDILVANYFADGARILDRHAATGDRMQDSMSRAFNGGSTYFFLQTGDGPGDVTYRPVDTGLPDDVLRGWTLAASARDLDGDLLPEVYLANDFGPDRLLANASSPGRLRLRPVAGSRGATTPRSLVLGRDSFKGMGVDFGDLDGDGRTDIFVGNITTPYALHESNMAFLGSGPPDALRSGRAPFVERSEDLGLARSGWAWDAKLADLDNDGTVEVLQTTGFLDGTANRWAELQELAMANDELLQHPSIWPRFAVGDDLSGDQGMRMFVYDGDRYTDVATSTGLADATVSRGIALGDVDADGDLDLAVARQWNDFLFYRNDCDDGCGSSLVLRLRRPTGSATDQGPTATTATTAAIGAVAAVHLPDGRRLTGEVDGGGGHSGRRSDEVHFGLGDVREPVTVELRWRDDGGTVRHRETRLRPGRHTIVLGER